MGEKRDEWSAFADMLGNLIAKYYDVLDIDSLPDPLENTQKTEQRIVRCGQHKIIDAARLTFSKGGGNIDKDNILPSW